MGAGELLVGLRGAGGDEAAVGMVLSSTSALIVFTLLREQKLMRDIDFNITEKIDF